MKGKRGQTMRAEVWDCYKQGFSEERIALLLGLNESYVSDCFRSFNSKHGQARRMVDIDANDRIINKVFEDLNGMNQINFALITTDYKVIEAYNKMFRKQNPVEL